jgi:hypothetical protein
MVLLRHIDGTGQSVLSSILKLLGVGVQVTFCTYLLCVLCYSRQHEFKTKFKFYFGCSYCIHVICFIFHLMNSLP